MNQYKQKLRIIVTLWLLIKPDPILLKNMKYLLNSFSICCIHYLKLDNTRQL